VDYAITLVAALLLGIGFVLQQQTAERAPESHFLSLKLFGDLFRKRKWLTGIVLMIMGQVLAAWSIGHLSLSVVEPLLTTNLLVALILAVPLSHQAVRVTEVAGALLLIAGETILSLARSVEPIGRSFGSFSHWPAAAGIACIAFAAVQAGRHRSGKQRATLTGLGAGLVFGIQDALTRQALQILQHHGMSGLLHSWSAYCLLATGAVGLLLMQSAFNAGPLHASLPTITAGEPVAGILLGIVVFGDEISLSPASLAMHAGGLAALVLGVILVARAPALSNLRKAVVEPVSRRLDTGPQRTLSRTADAIPSRSGANGPGANDPDADGSEASPPAARNGDEGFPALAEPPPAARNGDEGFPALAEPPPAARNGGATFALPAAPPTPVPPDPPR
jgi:drug/metabolite transporter (DMT)-like permease